MNEWEREREKKKLEQLMTIGVLKKIWQNVVRAHTLLAVAAAVAAMAEVVMMEQLAMCTVRVREQEKKKPTTSTALVDSHGTKRMYILLYSILTHTENYSRIFFPFFPLACLLCLPACQPSSFSFSCLAGFIRFRFYYTHTHTRERTHKKNSVSK